MRVINVFSTDGNKLFSGTRQEVHEKYDVNITSISTYLTNKKAFKKKFYFSEEETIEKDRLFSPKIDIKDSIISVFSKLGDLVLRDTYDKVYEFLDNDVKCKNLPIVIKTSIEKSTIINKKYILSLSESFSSDMNKQMKIYLFDITGKQIDFDNVTCLSDKYNVKSQAVRNSLLKTTLIDNKYYASYSSSIETELKTRKYSPVVYVFDANKEFLKQSTNIDLSKELNCSRNLIYHHIRQKTIYNKTYYFSKSESL